MDEKLKFIRDILCDDSYDDSMRKDEEWCGRGGGSYCCGVGYEDSGGEVIKDIIYWVVRFGGEIGSDIVWLDWFSD